MNRIGALGLLLVLLAIPARHADAGLVWAQVTAAGPTNFSGTVGGVAFTGTDANFGGTFTNTAGTSNFFSGQAGTFTPSLPLSYAIGLFSESGFTINFAQPVLNPVFDIFSLSNTLDFGTPVTLLSGGPSNFGGVPITVSGNRVIGQSIAGGLDANGTIALTRSFTSLAVTTPVIVISDGISIIFAVDTGPSPVPEPSTLTMAGIGAFSLVGYGIRTRWRRRIRTAS